MFLLYGLVEVKNRAEQGLEWRARETRINLRFRSSRSLVPYTRECRDRRKKINLPCVPAPAET